MSWVGPGSKFSLWYGLSWVGSKKCDPRTTLIYCEQRVEINRCAKQLLYVSVLELRGVLTNITVQSINI